MTGSDSRPLPTADEVIAELESGAPVLKTSGRPGGQDYYFVDGELTIASNQLARIGDLGDLVDVDNAVEAPGSSHTSVPVRARGRSVPSLVDELRARGIDASPHHVMVLGRHTQFGPHDAPMPIAAGSPLDPLKIQAAQILNGTTGAGSDVVIIDTGVLPPGRSPDIHAGKGLVYTETDPPGALSGKRIKAYVGHGTFVAGIVLINEPTARVFAFRPKELAGSSNGATMTLSDGGLAVALARALAHMAGTSHGAITKQTALTVAQAAATDIRTSGQAPPKVLNLSLAGPAHAPGINPLVYSRPVLNEWIALGVEVVAAAGNEHREDPHYPAAYPDVTGVGALNELGTIADFSNYGSWVNAYVEGVDVVSSYLKGGNNTSFVEVQPPSRRVRSDGPWDGFAAWSGTSFATPRMAAILAK